MPRNRLTTAFCGLIILGIAGCAHRGPGASGDGIAAANSAATDAKAPIVRVYNQPGLATVAVVAWLPDDPDVGLYGVLRRDGSLYRDSHYLSLGYTRSPLLDVTNTGQKQYFETIVPVGKLLENANAPTGYRLCDDGPPCFEASRYSARLPDDLLRTNRDSVAVRFFRPGSEVIATIRRDVIDAYLASADSVSRALKGK
ncbi:MAG: hypothetical protein ABIS03_12700 [Gemmatimonadaceae bacterium]